MIAHLESINWDHEAVSPLSGRRNCCALLNVEALVGASLIYGMSMLGSISSLFSGSGDAGGTVPGRN